MPKIANALKADLDESRKALIMSRSQAKKKNYPVRTSAPAPIKQPAFLKISLMDENDQPVSALMAMPKDFKTGSRGYHTMEKIAIGDKRYQVNLLFVEIGSKEKGG